MKDLALYDPYKMKSKMGIKGTEFTVLAWGVDNSNSQAFIPQ